MILKRILSRLRPWLFALLLGPTPALAQPLTLRFADELQAFRAQDAASPPPACPTLFVGSSSIRLWGSLVQDMSPLPVLNRGFGGAQITDVNDHFAELVAAYRPRAIVFYAGENDLADGRPPEEVVADFQRFMDMKTAALGATPVFFVSLKPSLLRLAQLEQQGWVNDRIRDLAQARSDLRFLDLAPLMMNAGQPLPLYMADGLHLNPDGYALWRAEIGRALAAEHVDTRTCAAPPVEAAAARPGKS